MVNDFTPDTEQVRAHYVFDQTNRWDPERGEAFDRWQAADRAKVWDDALKHVAALSDPAYTINIIPDRELITLGDVSQAMIENPYRKET